MTTTNRTGRLILRCACGADYAALSDAIADGAKRAERLGWRVGPMAGTRLGRSGRWWWHATGVCPGCAERKAA